MIQRLTDAEKGNQERVKARKNLEHVKVGLKWKIFGQVFQLT